VCSDGRFCSETHFWSDSHTTRGGLLICSQQTHFGTNQTTNSYKYPNWLTRVLVQVENGDQLFWKKLEENTRHHVDGETFQIPNSTNWSRIQQGTKVFIVLAFNMHEDLTFGMSSLSLSLPYLSQFFFFGQSFAIWWIIFQKNNILSTFHFSSPKKLSKIDKFLLKQSPCFYTLFKQVWSIINMWFWKQKGVTSAATFSDW
jgi:hypothetical protein